jgi:hypothetical protein
MNLSVNQLVFLLENQLRRHCYRRLQKDGTIWVPPDVKDDEWPLAGAQCIAVSRELALHCESGLLPASFAVSLCTHRVHDKCFWVHQGRPIFSGLHDYEIAVCQATAVGIDRQLPVCLDRPEVSHALGDVGILRL